MPIRQYRALPDGITHALFDADQTLYPRSSGFETHLIMDRIKELVHKTMEAEKGAPVPFEDALALANQYYAEYGSSYLGLEADFGIPLEESLDFIYHDGGLDYSALSPCERTRAGLEVMRFERCIRLAILSNGTDVHVHQVLSAMSLTGLFGVVHGFNHNGYKPKPDPSTIENTLWDMNAQAERTIFIEDNLSNLRAARSLKIGFNVYIGEALESAPDNDDNAFDLWATTLPEALDALNQALAEKQEAA